MVLTSRDSLLSLVRFLFVIWCRATPCLTRQTNLLSHLRALGLLPWSVIRNICPAINFFKMEQLLIGSDGSELISRSSLSKNRTTVRVGGQTSPACDEPTALHNRQFYGTLALLSLLNPSPSRPIPQASLNINSEGDEKVWHRFLDHLSWLGDSKCGGRTVTAIAAEAAVAGPQFWIGSNTGVSSRTAKHLTWVLQRLEKAETLAAPDLHITIRKIAKESIVFSRVRFNDYLRRLRSTMRAIEVLGLESLGAYDISQPSAPVSYTDWIIGKIRRPAHTSICFSYTARMRTSLLTSYLI